MSDCNHARTQKYGKTRTGEQRFRCLDCSKTYVESTRALEGMRIGLDKAAQIVQCTMEGMGIRSTARLASVSKDTVLDLLVLVGERCADFMAQAIVAVPVQEVQ